MNRTPINPWPWSLPFGFNQGEVVEGQQRTLYCAGQTAIDGNGQPQHPDDLPAPGHVSHDTDGNDPDLGWAMLEATREAGIPTTWCTIEPGYDTEFYKAVLDYGSEIALHYDALDGRTRTSWGPRTSGPSRAMC